MVDETIENGDRAYATLPTGTGRMERRGGDAARRPRRRDADDRIVRHALSHRPAPDGLSLELTYESGGGAMFDRVERGPNGPRTLAALRKATVVLARPLRERKMVEARSGNRVRRRGVPRL